MKQITQGQFSRGGKTYRNVSSPATAGTAVQITDILFDNGILKVSTDNGETFNTVVLPDGVTINKNTNGELQVVGITNGTGTLTFETIKNAISTEWEV